MPLVPPYIESLRPYEAGRTIESVRKQYGLTHIANLGSNENPWGASPKAREAMIRSLSGLNLYGLPNCLRISAGTGEDTNLCVEALRRGRATSIGRAG